MLYSIGTTKSVNFIKNCVVKVFLFLSLFRVKFTNFNLKANSIDCYTSENVFLSLS